MSYNDDLQNNNEELRNILDAVNELPEAGSGEPIPGEDGGYYIPSVEQADSNTMRVSYTASKEGMQTVPEATVTLPAGDPGKTPEKGKDYFTEADKEEFLSGMDAVRYVAQTLTDAQKAQARDNIGAQPAGNYALKSEIPAVPVQSVNGKTGAVQLSASDVGAEKSGTAAAAVSQHNVAEDAHNDIRLELEAINNKLTAFFDSDDQTLDELSEIVAYITSNKSLIDSITTSKVSVADIINNLTTNVADKPLSAAQGVVLKGLIDTVSNSLSNYQPKGEYALASAVPTKVSQLQNDSGFVADAVRYAAQTLTDAQKAQARRNIGVVGAVTPQDYGAKGNGSTDDTAAFQNALANNRIVFVPGGSYKISAELIIGNNCQLELSQDATLYFTQTTGNCISLLQCSWIKGNHATVSVPYGFTGNVVNIDTGYTDDLYATPPFKHWDPVWKPGRYVTDLNIIKPNSYNLCYSDGGECSGTAVFIQTDGNDLSTFLWGVDLSGLRIAGAFTYGVYGRTDNVNGDSGWNHDMKVGGLIAGCETGVRFVRVHKVYLSTLIQPQKSRTSVAYAKQGIRLENCRYMNLINARTFDWNSNFTLWEEGNENQHIALYGDCSGLVLEDWNYYAFGADYDIRSLIYTDTPTNLERMVILQEPITRWFKPKDGTPYFYDGNAEKRLTLKEEFDECFIVDRIANFEDVLSTAFNKDGTIFNEIGYIPTGAKWVGSSGELVTGSDYSYYGATGFIEIKNGDIIHADALNFGSGTDAIPCVVVYDANFNRVDHASAVHLTENTKSYFYGYTVTENGFSLEIKNRSTAAYVTFTFPRGSIGERPVISVNEPITFSQGGFLADTILVKSEKVQGLNDVIDARITTAIGSAIGGSY